jgi:hypothetical protein
MAPRSHTSLDRKSAEHIQARDIVASTWRTHSRRIVEEHVNTANTAARAEAQEAHPPIETSVVEAEVAVRTMSTAQMQQNSIEKTTQTWLTTTMERISAFQKARVIARRWAADEA